MCLGMAEDLKQKDKEKSALVSALVTIKEKETEGVVVLAAATTTHRCYIVILFLLSYPDAVAFCIAPATFSRRSILPCAINTSCNSNAPISSLRV